MTTVDRIGVLSGAKLSVKIPEDRVPDDNSFRSVSTSPDRDDATVMLEAGLTRLRIDGYDVTFDGFRYFPTDYQGDRRDVEYAKVDFETSGWEYEVGDDHPLRTLRVGDLISALRRGAIEPLPKADDTV